MNVKLHSTALDARSNAARRNWLAESEQFAVALPAELVHQLIADTGAAPATIRAMGIGWSSADRAFTVPLPSAADGPSGLHLWRLDGWNRVLGRAGLILPPGYRPGEPRGQRLIIATSVSDTLTLTGQRLSIVGCPDLLAARNELVAIQTQQQPRQTLILASGNPNDLRRAEAMQAVLRAFGGSVRVVRPPIGYADFSAWVRAGATLADVLAVIEAGEDRPRWLVEGQINGFKLN